MTTLAEVFDAIEKNGLPKTKQYYYDYEIVFEADGTQHNLPIAACALGMAAFNLGIKPEELYWQLNDVAKMLGHTITVLNDDYDYTFAEIANELRHKYEHLLTEEI